MSTRATWSRVIVLGCSGSGKTTLAADIAERLGLPFTGTDDVYWRPDWTPTPSAEVRAWIEQASATDRWVLDGNFDAQRDVLWGRAQLAVWLDLPWSVTIRRVLVRNLGWWWRRTPIWGGLRMPLSKAWSGVLHAARSHALKQRTYPELLAGYPTLQVVRLRSKAEVGAWLSTLP